MVLKIIWLAASGYLVFNFFKLLPPFKRRRWVFFWLLVVQAVSVGALAGLSATPEGDSSAPALPHVAQAPAKTPQEPEPDIDKLIVHTDPNAPEKPPSAAARKDARLAKDEMRGEISRIEAAAAIMKDGMESGKTNEIEMVRQDMNELEIKLIKRKPPLGAELWPERDDTGFGECSTAADRLSMAAESGLRGVSVQSVKSEMDFQAQFFEAYGNCKRWLASKP